MKESIYLIDKDPAVVDVISLLLADEGYVAVISKKPFDIQDLKEAKPRLIILHNGLDQMGQKICRELKADTELRNIPILMSSTTSNLQQVADECGADAYISKPFDINEFSQMVRELLGKATTK